MPDAQRTVDLDQPILVQVGDLGDAYDAWVHDPVRPRGSLRIFRRDGLEAMSHIPWWLVLAVWAPVVVALAALAAAWRGVAPGRLAVLAASGVVAWTLVEYLLHRFVFHWRPSSSFGRRLHFLAHGVHHKDPWDPMRLVFPPLAAVGLAIPFFLAFWGVASLTANPLGHAMAFMAGFVAGYLAYDVTHYAMHHARPRTAWGRYLKRYHLAHHHQHPRRLYGVSSPLWDFVFGTGFPRARA